MITEPQYTQKMTAEEYLEWEAKQELRHEYIDGEILAMTGGTLPPSFFEDIEVQQS